MAVSLKHSKTSVKDDGPDSSFVQPSDWNAEHTLTLGPAKLIGRSSAGTGAAEEIAVGSGLSLTAGTLSATFSGAYSDLTGKPTYVSTFTNDAGYLTAETDPTVPAHVKAITATNITNWDAAYGWGNHAAAGYLTASDNITVPDELAYDTTGSVLPAVAPVLNLNFVQSNVVDPRITFTRSSTATFVGSNGLIQTAAANTPRLDYDPATLAPKGLLVEEQRTNLLVRSEEFDNASWSKTRSSVIANAVISPDGTVNADKLVEDTTATQTHTVSQTSTVAAGASYTFSVYLKPAGRDFARILVGDTGGNNGVRLNINLTSGETATAIAGAGWTLNSASATAVGNGWYRVSVSGANATATSGVVIIYAATSLSTVIYTGDGTSGLFIWGAQLETGSFATSYIPTVASQVTRSADVATMTGTSFSSWYNATQGTFVASFSTIWSGNAPVSSGVIGFDGSASKRLIYIPSGVQVAATWDGTLALSSVNVVPGPSKVASAYDTGRAIIANGVNLTTGTMAAGYSTATSLNVGNYAGINFLNGHIRSIQYFNTRLSNSVLQGITA